MSKGQIIVLVVVLAVASFFGYRYWYHKDLVKRVMATSGTGNIDILDPAKIDALPNSILEGLLNGTIR